MTHEQHSLSPDLTARVRLLHARLQQVRRVAQSAGSGALVHVLANEIATAHSTLLLVEARASSASREHLEELLELADASLHSARVRIAQRYQRVPPARTEPEPGD
jgi:hypothetical protein